MPFITDPYSGLQLIELSHMWGHGVPSYPGQDDVRMYRAVKHSQHGVLAWKINTDMHTGTHMNAPIHLIQKGADMAAIPPDRLFGNGVVLDIPKSSYETITADDLEKSGQEVRKGDVVAIVTGWHKKYSDSIEYYGESPGLSKDAAQWLAGKECRFVAIDTPQIDHPLATSLGPHRGGPLMKRLADDYHKATGLDCKKEHGEWNAAHKILLAAGIPTIEQMGGDVNEIKGKRVTFAALPWKFSHGDACPVRLVAMIDQENQVRIDAGN